MTTCLIKLLPVPRSGVERSAAFTTLASNGRARLAMPTLPSCLSKCRLDMTVLNGRPMILEVIWLLAGSTWRRRAQGQQPWPTQATASLSTAACLLIVRHLLRAMRRDAAHSADARRIARCVAADFAAFERAGRAFAVRDRCFLDAHRRICAARRILRIGISTAAQRHCHRNEQRLDPSLHTSSCTSVETRSPIKRCPRRDICRSGFVNRRQIESRRDNSLSADTTGWTNAMSCTRPRPTCAYDPMAPACRAGASVHLGDSSSLENPEAQDSSRIQGGMPGLGMAGCTGASPRRE